jgi:SAM-dependent methyltransferase
MLIKKLFKKCSLKIGSLYKKKFSCPICGYHGPFKTYFYRTIVIKHYSCPQCLSASRHRLQYLAVKQLSEHYDFSDKFLLHFAPEACMQNLLKQMSGAYCTSDISAKEVDCLADLCHLPFKTQSCDIIFASHVMEHIHDDRAALKEIWRILKPGGIAILPVPVLGPFTVEYPERNMEEYEHVRSPGLDYFRRYEEIFPEVQIFSSNDFPEKYQTFVYEDRENWPETMPLRPKSKGKKHTDFVPVCFKR